MTSEIFKVDAEKFGDSDKYGHKAMLKRVNELYRCPEDKTFLKWKDEKKGIAVCSKCGFERKMKRE